VSESSQLKKFIEKRMPFYGLIFDYQPPTEAQLNVQVNRLSVRIFKAQLAAICVAVVGLFIAYNMAFTELNEELEMFSPLCLIPLSVAALIMLFVKYKTDKLKTLRDDFLPSSNHVMASMNPDVNEYLALLEARGRGYVTNYENSRLFNFSESRMEL